MKAQCPYCDKTPDSRGVKRHVALVHPNMVAEFGMGHVSPNQGKGIRKELMMPETTKETAWYDRLKRRTNPPGAKKLVLVRSENSIDPWSVKNMTDTPTPSPNSVAPAEKKYECGECFLQFDELQWADGGASCPRCGAIFEDADL